MVFDSQPGPGAQPAPQFLIADQFQELVEHGVVISRLIQHAVAAVADDFLDLPQGREEDGFAGRHIFQQFHGGAVEEIIFFVRADNDIHEAEEAGNKVVGHAAGKEKMPAKADGFGPAADRLVLPALPHEEKDHPVMGRDDFAGQGDQAPHVAKKFERADVADYHPVLETPARRQFRIRLPGSEGEVIHAVGHDMEFGSRHLIAHQVAFQDLRDADYLVGPPDIDPLNPPAQPGVPVVLGIKQVILVLQGRLGEQHQGQAPAAAGRQDREVGIRTHRQHRVGVEFVQQLQFLPEKAKIPPDQTGDMTEPAQPADVFQAEVIPVLPRLFGGAELHIHLVAQPGQGRGDGPDLGGRANGGTLDIVVVIEIGDLHQPADGSLPEMGRRLSPRRHWARTRIPKRGRPMR